MTARPAADPSVLPTGPGITSSHSSRNRKEFGVGAVLETIQAEQELTRTRLDHLRLVAEHNQAQYALRYALGE